MGAAASALTGDGLDRRPFATPLGRLMAKRKGQITLRRNHRLAQEADGRWEEVAAGKESNAPSGGSIRRGTMSPGWEPDQTPDPVIASRTTWVARSGRDEPPRGRASARGDGTAAIASGVSAELADGPEFPDPSHRPRGQTVGMRRARAYGGPARRIPRSLGPQFRWANVVLPQTPAAPPEKAAALGQTAAGPARARRHRTLAERRGALPVGGLETDRKLRIGAPRRTTIAATPDAAASSAPSA